MCRGALPETSKAKARQGYLRLLANLLINQKRSDEALKILKEGEERFKNDYLIDYFLGEAYYLKGNYREARRYLEKSVSENPEFESAYLLLGKVYQSSSST